MRTSLLLITTTAAALALAAPGATAVPAAERPQPDSDPDRGSVLVEAFGRGGHPFTVSVPASRGRAGVGSTSSTVTTIRRSGHPASRLDLVFVGDGYTADEQDLFHQHVRDHWAELRSVQPYVSYDGLFNVWAVDVVSAESGVDGDPTEDVVKDTALDSAFWCAGVERLLCTDTQKVVAFARQAPATDAIVMLANSTKYGGAGYSTVSTASGGNIESGQILVHETGHTIGALVDEYFYAGLPEYDQWPGGEPSAVNASELTASQMLAVRAKWWRWLDAPSPDGGVVSTYEGAFFYVHGVYRPSEASLMRVLGQPFNPVGREAMVAGFAARSDLLTSPVPTTRLLGPDDVVVVRVPRLADPVRVRWYRNGYELARLRGQTRVLAGDALRPRDQQVRLDVRVVDPTTFVRDPAIRAQLRDRLAWTVRRSAG